MLPHCFSRISGRFFACREAVLMNFKIFRNQNCDDEVNLNIFLCSRLAINNPFVDAREEEKC